MTPSPAQVRAARALLNIGRDDLAKLSGVSERAIGNYEMGRTKFIRSNREAVRKTLEQLGVEFLGGDGVRRKED
jgi:transcriptional regulator with XRE-family HTH domain